MLCTLPAVSSHSLGFTPECAGSTPNCSQSAARATCWPTSTTVAANTKAHLFMDLRSLFHQKAPRGAMDAPATARLLSQKRGCQQSETTRALVAVFETVQQIAPRPAPVSAAEQG